MRTLGYATALVALCFLSCATNPGSLPPVSLNFFTPAPPDNPWKQKIENWQARHHLDPVNRGEDPRASSKLSREYDQFAANIRRKVANETVSWVQEHSRRYYRPDGDQDHWATLGEVVEAGGDDCDGLDLLTFVLLRRLGFQESEIYRAIVVEQNSGQHHMVTLWFEEGAESDPWVLDPTGVVTSKMVRLAEVPGWEPIELFDEAAHFNVEESRLAVADAVSDR
ncbi:MAG: hypothetical protein GY725_16150 [bacterium]|nr:hypothetical protein [bacterium]